MNDATPLVLVISCSLNPDSNSALLAEAARRLLAERGVSHGAVDLRELDLPICDGDTAYDHPAVQRLEAQIEAADAVLVAAPVYNYDVNAAAKNLVELTGSAWEGKPVGLMVAAGGRNSYMAPIGLANSLMFDFRCYVVPRFVYAVRADFKGDGGLDAALRERLARLVDATLHLARGLRHAG